MCTNVCVVIFLLYFYFAHMLLVPRCYALLFLELNAESKDYNSVQYANT